MPTTKRRIPVTLPVDLEKYLETFASTHNVSLSQAIVLLARYGLNLAEDDELGLFADELDTQVTSWKDHKNFWSEVYSV